MLGSTRKFRLVTILVIVFVLTSVVIPAHSARAQEIKNEIRVALFVDVGIGHQQTVPVVSLSSQTGLEIKGESGPFTNVGEASYIRFALDQYYLLIKETKQESEARSLSHQLHQQGISNTIIQLTKNNELVYRVISSSEATEAAISTLQRDLKSKANVDAQLAGPFRVQAGSFTALAEANQRLQEIQAKDYTAYLVQVRQPQALSYQVWVGDEINATQAEQVKTRLQSEFPGLEVQPAQGEEYIIHTQTPLFSSPGSTAPFYLMTTKKKINVLPKGTANPPVIKVEERSNRTYRGKIELSRHNNKFTVVNVLPLEHYLYSVVGTEMATGWPLEALKAQAIMARNYAYLNIASNKYGIAHLSDTVFEQAYHGYGKEAPDIRQAVDSTSGEFLTYKGQVFSTFFYSNAGGMTADGREVWGNSLETHSVVKSPDQYPETIAATWYRVQDAFGKIGYVHSQFVTSTSEKSSLGFSYGVINTPTLNYRSGPSTDHALIGLMKQGDRVLIFEEMKENNSYSWISGPFTAQEVATAINGRNIQNAQPIASPVLRLTVTERGDSGRVMRMEANGVPVLVSSPDAHRSIFKENNKSLRSTKFEVEEMGSFTVLGAGGKRVSYPQSDQPAQLYALSAKGTTSTTVNPNSDQFAALGNKNQLRIVSKAPMYRFLGNGFGHGLGASQWGIRAMAADGYDYRQILKHYFHKDSAIEKKY